ncbi:MAG TPA: hypothetical protein P5186_10180 [Candidatus Paceibacterota bacterium]|nr:hypothetical protein [Candidatus Paceibacterota bacterium]HSA01878.1 hypothetical protein [Candidatus Paceibacterota bacterium]
MKSWILILVGLVLIVGLAMGLGWWLSREGPLPDLARSDSESAEGSNPAASSAKMNARHAFSRPQPSVTGNLKAANETSEDDSTRGPQILAIEQYLAAKGRNADTLLAAFFTSQDKVYLKEAAQQYPDNAQVQLAMIVNRVSPEDQRTWIEKLKQTDPSNSVGYYLSALEYFRQKNPQAALQELISTSSLGLFNNYRREQSRQLEDMQLGMGSNPADAKATSMQAGLGMQLLSGVKELSQQMIEQQKQYLQANEVTTASLLANLGTAMARRLNYDGAGSLVIDQLVGIAVERQFLSQLDPAASPDYIGQPVSHRLDQLQRIEEDFQQQDNFLSQYLQSQPNDNVRLEYLNRVQASGEAAALRWLRSRGTSP